MSDSPELAVPARVLALADQLASIDGVAAVTLGGSSGAELVAAVAVGRQLVEETMAVLAADNG